MREEGGNLNPIPDPALAPIGQAQPQPGELSQYIEDPVDVINGNLIWEYTDFELYGAQKLSFSRHYNSQSKRETRIGVGWRHSFDYNIRINETSGEVRLTVPNGYEYTFNQIGNAFILVSPANVSLEKTNWGYIYTNYDETKVYFENSNAIKIIDANENVTTLSYNAQGQLESASNRAGEIFFTYHPSGKINTVYDNNNRVVSYEYDIYGNLTKFTNTDEDEDTKDKHALTYSDREVVSTSISREQPTRL